MFKKIRNIAKVVPAIILPVTAFAFLPSCGKSGTDAQQRLDSHNLPDTLVIATLYSPSSYFIYRDEPMGFDYDLIHRFTEAKGLEPED